MIKKHVASWVIANFFTIKPDQNFLWPFQVLPEPKHNHNNLNNAVDTLSGYCIAYFGGKQMKYVVSEHFTVQYQPLCDLSDTLINISLLCY